MEQQAADADAAHSVAAPRMPLRLMLLCGVLLYWGALFVGTHLPGNPSDHQDQALPHLDKLVHAAAFAGLATLVLAGAAGWWRPGVGLGLAVIGLLALYAGLDEFTQGFVQLREPDPRDWVADMLGVLVGTAVFFQGWKLVRRGRATRLANQSGVSR
jgi:VanZ family protein